MDTLHDELNHFKQHNPLEEHLSFETHMRQQYRQYALIEQAIAFLLDHQQQQPSLDTVAQALHVSPFHLQRTFKRWAGLTPKQFLQVLTRNAARECLHHSTPILEAAWQAGLSGAGRLHDLMVLTEAASPGEIKQRGRQLTICYAWHLSPFGDCFIAVTPRGICQLGFCAPDDAQPLQRLYRQWPEAQIRQDSGITAAWLKRIFTSDGQTVRLPLQVKGSHFQIKVWEALLSIPPGAVASYQQIARLIGQPSATRAVGTAIGNNPIACLIPCHRVLRSSGALGGYHWGLARKQALLIHELC